MNGRTGTIRPYKKRSVEAPKPTVKRMKYVLERHLRPFGGLELLRPKLLSMVDMIFVSQWEA
jgi:hypothetical protein